ncbi:MAG: 50S ribosomal protein L3 [Pirellulales bacterium]|nr:50S ribosomal protein L3 [Pirellulales bacterium]
MSTGILGRKVGMTQVYDESGRAVPVTVIEAGPCHVLQVRTRERDGYNAVQLGFADKPRRLARRSERGHVAKIESARSRSRADAGVEVVGKAGAEPKRYVREFRGEAGDATVGQEVKVDIFSEEDSVDVTGTSKGRGFSGVMRRHNFAGQRASHGVKKVHRHPGGTGCSAYPSRVFKGKRMAGQYGNARCTVRNLKVVGVDAEKNLLLVEGGIPGPNGGFLVIRKTNMLK